MRAPLLSLAALLCGGPASAQSICDHITVESIAYAPFGNGLEVVIHNGNDEFLSYPIVQLIDAQGDTLGHDAMTFFGIMGQSSQLHQVEFDGPAPTNPFTGTLLFHYIDQNGAGTCSIPIGATPLCPPVMCHSVEIGVYFLSNTAAAELTWTITDIHGAAVEQGTLVVDPDGSGFDSEAMCLPAGNYTLHVVQTSLPALEFPIVLASPDFSSGGHLKGNLDAGGHLMLPFPLFGPCIAIGQAVDELEPSAPLIRMLDQQLHIRTMDDSPLGALQLIDAMGRAVKQLSANGSASIVIDMAQHATGTYLVRSLDPQQPWKAQRFFLP